MLTPYSPATHANKEDLLSLSYSAFRQLSDMDARFYGHTLHWLLKKDVLKKESCFALNFGYKGQLPCPQFPIILQSDLGKNMPVVTWHVDPESKRFPGIIDGPPPGRTIHTAVIIVERTFPGTE